MSSPSTLTLSGVQVKPPPFLPTNPAAWFIIMEAQFHLANITASKTQFYHSLAALPPDVVGQLSASELTSQKYDELKAKIIELHEASKPEILDSFLRDRPLTGKPSQYLKEMQRLAAKAGIGDDLVRHKFQQALPSNLAPIIATQKSTTFDDLGKLADELYSFGAQNVAINRVPCATHSSEQTPPNRTHISKDLGLTPFSPDQRPKICRAHIFFADRAKRCRSWCQWPDKTRCTVVRSARSTPRTSPCSSRGTSPSRSSN